jgi:hypothetical protein
MANKKITDLVDIGTPASGDLLEIVDISEGVSKRVAVSALGGGSTPTLQEVTDEGNEIVSDDNLNKIVIDKVLQTITFYGRYLITDPWVITSQVTQGGFYVDPTGTFFGGTTATLDVFTGLTVSDDFLNGINITSISATKNGVEFATLDDIPPAITIDATPTDGSANAVSSNGVFDALALKANLENVEQIIRSKSNGTFGSHTGDIAETVILSIDINANEFVAGDWMTLLFSGEKDLGVGNVTWRLRAGVNGNTSDNQIALLTATGANSRYSALYRGRPQFLTGNQLRIFSALSTSTTDIGISGAASLISLTPTSAWKLTLTAQLTVLTETASLTGYRIGKIKSF